jgi:hypothetical protein
MWFILRYFWDNFSILIKGAFQYQYYLLIYRRPRALGPHGGPGTPRGPVGPGARSDLGAPEHSKGSKDPLEFIAHCQSGDPWGPWKPIWPCKAWGLSNEWGPGNFWGERNPWDPGNPWGPRTSGSLEIFGCPINPGDPKIPHFLSFLKMTVI